MSKPTGTPRPRDPRQTLGDLGERIAERWLRRRGCRILARRWRSGHRDVDLIVEEAGTIAFVEVKARRGDGYGDPAAAVTWRKQRELSRSASIWIDRHGPATAHYRFDVVAILILGTRVRIRHLVNAFPVHRPR